MIFLRRVLCVTAAAAAADVFSSPRIGGNPLFFDQLIDRTASLLEEA